MSNHSLERARSGPADGEDDNPAKDLDKNDDASAILWTGHPSYLGYLYYFVFGVVFIVLGSLYLSFMLWSIALGASMVMVAILDRNNKVYAITDVRILARAHIHHYSDDIKIKEITDVSLHHGAVERLFGLGTVKIVSEVLTEHDEVVEEAQISFKGIKYPQEIMAKIEELRGKQPF
ncbi:PH domain-containing protein [Chloroflexota bacterium]